MSRSELIKFQRCSVDHCEILHSIAVQSYHEHYSDIWEDQGQAYLARFYTRDIFENELQKSTAAYYLIYHLATPVGFLKLRENALAPYSPNDCLELNKIYLLQAHTGKGIGHHALQFVFDQAKAKSKRIIWMNVMAESKARKFYEHYGFKCCHEVSLNYPHMKAGLNVLSTYKLEITKF